MELLKVFYVLLWCFYFCVCVKFAELQTQTTVAWIPSKPVSSSSYNRRTNENDENSVLKKKDQMLLLVEFMKRDQPVFFFFLISSLLLFLTGKIFDWCVRFVLIRCDNHLKKKKTNVQKKKKGLTAKATFT